MRLHVLLVVPLVASCMVGDAPADDDDSDTSDLVDTQPGLHAMALAQGVNGHYCVASPFNCRFRLGDARVTNTLGDDSWEITPGAAIRDGNGVALATETGTHLTFNYGQLRTVAGSLHALALTTSNASAGWYPVDHIVQQAAFTNDDHEVAAKDPGDGKLGCYAVRGSDDEALAALKVVYDSKEGPDGHERAGDYFPLVRADNRRSVNLVFSVPGFGLGGATTDHFLAGAKFQRVDVPTATGRPSIAIPLWSRDSEGRYRKRAGSMRFLYGYVRTANGARRFGWMARPALEVSSGCD